MNPGPEIHQFLQRCGVRNERLAAFGLLWRFCQDLVQANRDMNLTRLTSPAEFWTKHVADSLAIGLVAPQVLCDPLTVADVGCGAGFPLVPLAWANPDLRLLGIEANLRKARFLEIERERLGLTNCTVVARQAREVGRLEAWAASCDLVLARAVGETHPLIRGCRGLLKPEAGSRLIFYKTPDAIAAELDLAQREAAKFRFRLSLSPEFELPSGAGTRQFLVLTR